MPIVPPLPAACPAAQRQASAQVAAGTAGQDVLVFPAAFFAAAQPANALDMIARLPGFTFDPGDPAVRGLAAASGNVLVDGRRQATKDDLATVLRRIPAAAVLRIELIRGAAPGIDMQGQPMLANVVRRADTAVRGQAEIGDARYGDGRTAPSLRASLSRQGGGTLIEGALHLYRTIDDEKGFGPRRRIGAGGALLQQAWYDEHDGFRGGDANIAHERPLAGGRLRVTLSARRERERAATTLVTTLPAPGSENVLEVDTVDEGELGASWSGGLGPALTGEIVALQRLTRSDALDRADDGEEIEVAGERSHGAESVARGLLRWQPRPAFTVEGGAEIGRNVLDSHADLSTNGTAIALPAANVRVAERRLEPFVTATGRPAPTLTLEAGLRVEVSRLKQSGDSQLRKRFAFPKPRLLATWDAGARTQVRVRLERQVGQLDFGDFVSSASLTSSTVTAGNAQLEPDRRWMAQVAWERRFWGAGALVVTARRAWITHVYDRIAVTAPDRVFDAPGNIGSGLLMEVDTALSLPLDRLGLRGLLLKSDVTVRRSSVDDPTTGGRRAISGIRPLEGAIHLTQDLPTRRARWGADLILPESKTQFRIDEVRLERVGARASLFAEWQPMRGWTLRAFADNLTGRHIARDRAIYAGARDAAGLRFVEHRDLATRPLIGVLIRHSFER